MCVHIWNGKQKKKIWNLSEKLFNLIVTHKTIHVWEFKIDKRITTIRTQSIDADTDSVIFGHKITITCYKQIKSKKEEKTMIWTCFTKHEPMRFNLWIDISDVCVCIVYIDWTILFHPINFESIVRPLTQIKAKLMHHMNAKYSILFWMLLLACEYTSMKRERERDEGRCKSFHSCGHQNINGKLQKKNENLSTYRQKENKIICVHFCFLLQIDNQRYVNY